MRVRRLRRIQAEQRAESLADRCIGSAEPRQEFRVTFPRGAVISAARTRGDREELGVRDR